MEGLEGGGGLFIESPRAPMVLGLPFHLEFIGEEDSYQEFSSRSFFFVWAWASRFLGLVQGPNGSDVIFSPLQIILSSKLSYVI